MVIYSLLTPSSVLARSYKVVPSVHIIGIKLTPSYMKFNSPQEKVLSAFGHLIY